MIHKQIVYILSSSHSGSTLLSALLGAQEGIFCLGETDVFSAESKAIMPLIERQCSCQQGNYQSCPFWQKVERQLQFQTGFTLAELDLSSTDKDTFERHQEAFWSTVLPIIPEPIIVDSSKEVDGVAGMLAMELPVLPIYMVRSPLGVIASEARKGKSWFRETIGYLHYHMRIRVTLTGIPHFKVRYKDLAQSPEETLQKVLQYLGQPTTNIQLDWHQKPQHMLRGNGMIMRKDRTIRYDEKWRKELSFVQQLVILGITAILHTNWIRFFQWYLHIYRWLKGRK